MVVATIGGKLGKDSDPLADRLKELGIRVKTDRRQREHPEQALREGTQLIFSANNAAMNTLADRETGYASKV